MRIWRRRWHGLSEALAYGKSGDGKEIPGHEEVGMIRGIAGEYGIN